MNISLHGRLSQRAIATFVGTYDSVPRCLVQAPGRVNLIGEHTDYNDGFVLPCAIELGTLVAASPRTDTLVRVAAGDVPSGTDSFRVDQPIERHPKAPWANYVRGVFATWRSMGLPLGGMNLAIAGDVPRGMGLSSSASLELALATALAQMAGGGAPEPAALALLAQRAENDFVGCPCGVMDPLISALGLAGHALLIDCRSLQALPVPLPDSVAVLIVSSNVRRSLVESAYDLRRRQCSEAAAALGVPALRDATLDDLNASKHRLDPVVWRRARHVLTENARTQSAARMLAEGDLPALGSLMAESHRSMRDDYEVSVPEVDHLVGILQRAIGSEGGARLTGGGFGGCVVAVMPQDRVAAARRAVDRDYRAPDGRAVTQIVTLAAGGAGPLAAH